MGYSVFTLFETEQDRIRMENFLQQHFRPLKDIAPAAFTEELSETTPTPHSHLDYTGDFSEPKLGFDYGSGDSDTERGYSFLICYWMAIMAGKRKNNLALMVYDGDETWTICINGQDCKCQATIHTDKNGYRKIMPLQMAERTAKRSIVRATVSRITRRDDYSSKHIAELKMLDREVHQELIRLTTLWQNN